MTIQFKENMSNFYLEDIVCEKKDNGNSFRVSFNKKNNITLIESSSPSSFHCFVFKEGSLLQEFITEKSLWDFISKNFIKEIEQINLPIEV